MIMKKIRQKAIPRRRVRASKRAAASPARRRILVVDDHPMTREGVVAILGHEADLEICGQAGTPAEAIAAITRLKPDLMVSDLAMPGRGGIEFLKQVHSAHPELLILVLSMHDEMLYAERALRAGAQGYLMKDADPAKLTEAVRLILGGRTYISPRVSARILDAVGGRRPRGSASPIEKLTDREFEVFQLIGCGRSTREIATALNLSPKTVDVHRGRIKEKLGIKDATALLHHAVRWMEAQTPHPG